MKHYSICLFLLILTLIACENKTQTKDETTQTSSPAKFDFTIQGNIKNLVGPKVYLQGLVNEQWKKVDSSEVKNGSFSLDYSTPEQDFFLLQLDSQSVLLIVDSKEINIEADAANLHPTLKITGSKASTDYQSFHKQMMEYEMQLGQLQKQYVQFSKANNQPGMETTIAELKEMQNQSGKFVKSKIDSVIPSLAVFSMLNYLNPQQDFDFLVTVSERLNKQLPDSKYTRQLNEQVKSSIAMRQQQAEQEKNSSVAVGKKAPEITLATPAGKTVSLSSYKGKYVLIDFWASWCGPCRAENPNVVALYNKYKSKGFEIFGVSLDGDQNAWEQAIKKDKLTWAQVSDLKAWNSSVVPIYEITAIPSTFLLDKEGMIIAKNLRGKELEDKLAELFSK